MDRDMIKMLAAELFQLRKRTSTWILMAVWAAMGLLFRYVLPYQVEVLPMRGGDPIATLLPEQFISNTLGGFPFFGGAIALMLGVLSIGSEFDWGTFKTLFTQRAGRGKVFAAKTGALAIVLIPFVLVEFVIGAAASTVIASLEGVAIEWPPLQDILAGIGAAWVIFATWAALGMLLAVATRGTSLAVGIGIIWALVIESMLNFFATSISWLGWTNDVMLRSNAYSLIQPLGGGGQAEGPASFSGPYVDVTQALVTMMTTMLAGIGLSYLMLRRRDVA